MGPYSIQDALVRSQPQPIFALFDEATKRAAQPGTTAQHRKINLPGHPWEDWVEPVIDAMVDRGLVVFADHIEELAIQLGIRPENLKRTVDQYNAGAVMGQDPLFLKEAPEFREISTPPFYATELRLWHMALTATGPRIDARARVLDPTWTPIPRLFAAGECAGGVIGEKYVGSGNSWANAVVFGSIAGREAAQVGGEQVPVADLVID